MICSFEPFSERRKLTIRNEFLNQSQKMDESRNIMAKKQAKISPIVGLIKRNECAFHDRQRHPTLFEKRALYSSTSGTFFVQFGCRMRRRTDDRMQNN
jgi:hypothetical protein